MLLAALAPPVAAQPVSSAEATGALAQALRARGLTPSPESGLSLDDYIASTAADPDSRTVSFLLGPDGRLVPTDEWRDYHPDYCKARARHTRPASSRVSFRIVRNTERHDGRTRNQLWVFGRVADLGTGRYTEASEGEATNMTGVDRADEGWAADALEEAFAGLQTPMAAPESPCGEVRLEHVSGREVGDRFVFQAGFQGHGQHLGYAWDFGDGATAEGRSLQRPRHVYADKGTYPVRVTVYGPGDEVHEQAISVQVDDEPEADLATCTFTAEVSGAIQGTFDGTATAQFEGEGSVAEVTDVRLEGGGFQLDFSMYPSGHRVGRLETLSATSANLSIGDDMLEMFYFPNGTDRVGGHATVQIEESRTISVAQMPPELLLFTLGMAGGGREQAEAMLADPETRAHFEEQVGDIAVRGVVEGQLFQTPLIEPFREPAQVTFRAEFDAGSETLACDPAGFPDRVRAQMEALQEETGGR